MDWYMWLAIVLVVLVGGTVKVKVLKAVMERKRNAAGANESRLREWS